MTITIDQLVSHGISERVVALWRQSGIEALLPLQEEAVMRTGVLQNKSLIVFAPTSSGKTFIAELAALKQLEASRKVIYLVPTKALAEEKYRRFRRLYAPLGYRILVATRERPDADLPAMEGRFDLLIAVYEKMKSFLVQRPTMLSRAGLVVADEVQMLGEPERGSVVDLLLTKVTHSPYKAQFIGLSAVLGDALRLAQWLNCDLLKESRRPVELREGVYDAENGEFYYREFNSGVESRETLCPNADYRGAFEDEEAYAEAALGLAVHLAAERGEQVLIFVPTRAMSRQWAQKAAAMADLEPAESALAELGKYEETRERGLIASCFKKGTAFHNSDLTWGMRKLIEEQYNAGGIRLLVSTSTLGEGVNLTGRNVIHVPEMVAQDEWTGGVSFVPLSHARFRNQGGRAGRFGRVSDFGRSILVASGGEQAERLMREYIHGELEPLRLPMKEDDLAPAILDLAASHICHDAEGIISFLLKTYTGLVQWSAEPKPFEAACEREIGRLMERHFLTREEGALSATGIGAITAASGIRLGTASLLHRWLREVREVSPFEALLAAAFTPDAAEFSLPVSRRERREINYPETVRGHLSDVRIEESSVLREIFNRPGGYGDSDFSAFKKAVVLHEWIGSAETLAIEERYGVMAGTMAKLAEHFAWLIVSGASIAEALGLPKDVASGLMRLALRAQAGVGDEGAELALLRAEGLERSHLQALIREGYNNPESLRGADAERLRALLPHAVAEALIAECDFTSASSIEPMIEDAKEIQSKPSTDDEPILVVRKSEPGIVVCKGRRVRLTSLPWQLLLSLAQRPGEMVSYRIIDEEVWPEQKVERQQVSFHRSSIIRAISKPLGKARAEGLITTFSGQGLQLELAPEQVQVLE